MGLNGAGLATLAAIALMATVVMFTVQKMLSVALPIARIFLTWVGGAVILLVLSTMPDTIAWVPVRLGVGGLALYGGFKMLNGLRAATATPGRPAALSAT
jgi:hypothetical protein